MDDYWEIELHDEVLVWLLDQSEEIQERARRVISMLRARGLGLGRPLVDAVRGSEFANMKELRLGTARILFAFDPRRRAVLLVAGNKQGAWNRWYRDAIPVADARFIEWLEVEGAATWDS